MVINLLAYIFLNICFTKKTMYALYYDCVHDKSNNYINLFNAYFEKYNISNTRSLGQENF